MAPKKAKRKMEGNGTGEKLVKLEIKEEKMCAHCNKLVISYQVHEEEYLCQLCAKELVFKWMQVVTCITDGQVFVEESIRSVEESIRKIEEEKNTAVAAAEHAQKKIDKATAKLRALEGELTAKQAKKVQDEAKLSGCVEDLGLKNYHSDLKKKQVELANKLGREDGYGHAHTWEGCHTWMQGLIYLCQMISVGITRVHLKIPPEKLNPWQPITHSGHGWGFLLKYNKIFDTEDFLTIHLENIGRDFNFNVDVRILNNRGFTENGNFNVTFIHDPTGNSKAVETDGSRVRRQKVQFMVEKKKPSEYWLIVNFTIRPKGKGFE
ncbi:Oidioi.mRNA.OKI2018_I69.XSR.g13438.t1.cds [Oikopleura dioica]|uniref:Oidioi.mRNA.OKI2018_I69.XSR.g13438.t1.cds n=1 Tax=Oikopleura dioica TaxID=34765 RepID=A0ABN7S7C7_OIKDI|nr:Oidioi.mRNA.OKI2018_I69.XSR.g13438.t1.cds [Oikopleura dioica]